MNYKLFIRQIAAILLVLIVSVSYMQTEGQEKIRRIKYVDPVYTRIGGTQRPARMPSKEERVSSNKGNIVLYFWDAVPDSIKVAVTAAKELWESKIHNTVPMKIEVDWSSINDDNIATTTEVSYQSVNKIMYPCTLESYLSGIAIGGEEDAPGDALIQFNSDIAWNCSFTDDSVEGYNVYTMALRSIAVSLGFGTSLCKMQDEPLEISFYEEYPSIFDTLVYHDGKCLSSLNGRNDEITEFATSNNVHVKTLKGSYRLYAPEKYEDFKSMVYLEVANSLMSYDLGMGDKKMEIDDGTIDILNGIGWDIKDNELLKIQCGDISETGIGSSYATHTFTLNNTDSGVTSYNWKFSLKCADGSYASISTGANPEFEIPKVDGLASNYYINLNGDLEGRVECDYTVGGTVYKCRPFNVSLELKPTILNITDVKRSDNGNYTFSALFDVQYVGSDYITVEVEEEYSSVLRTARFDEPFYAHVATGNISSLYYSWVTVRAKNEYGAVENTIEFEPSYVSRSMRMSSVDMVQVCDNISVYSLQGVPVYEGPVDSFNKTALQSGIYIQSGVNRAGNTITSKILVP